MAERYWITGVQLGLLQTLNNMKARQKIVNQIVDEQFIGGEKELKKMFKKQSDVRDLKRIIKKYYGDRCPHYFRSCAICQAWSMYDCVREAIRDEKKK